MKPFNLEEAKAGAAICTRSGRKARIVCFDSRNVQPIVALIEDADNRYEITYNYDLHGKWDEDEETAHDLMMCEATDTLPKSWEEFCENYPVEDVEYFIDEHSKIKQAFKCDCREEDRDRILMRTEAQAEAMLAFIQLIRLRDVYRRKWEPDWNKEDLKYCIYNFMNEIDTQSHDSEMYPLSFQSEEIRDKFLENFRDLIEEAKEFI